MPLLTPKQEIDTMAPKSPVWQLQYRKGECGVIIHSIIWEWEVEYDYALLYLLSIV
jgi:hypothetical protein